MRSHQKSRHNFNTLNLAQRTRTRTSCGPSRPAGRSNSRVVVLKSASQPAAPPSRLPVRQAASPELGLAGPAGREAAA